MRPLRPARFNRPRDATKRPWRGLRPPGLFCSRGPEDKTDKQKWFHKLEQEDDTGRRTNQGNQNAIHKIDTIRKISEDEAPNAEFAQVNQAISEVPFDTDKELFSLTMLPGAVNVTKKGKVTINGEEVTGKEFVGAMSNAISECMDPQKRAYNERMADNICLIMEHFSNLCILDAVHTVKSKTTNESYSLMAHKNGYFIFENTKTSKTFKKFVSINESVSVIKKFTGINLHSIYAKECMNEMRDIQKIRKLREEQVKIVKDIDDLSLSIQNEQATLVPGTPAFEESVENLDTLKTEKEIAESNIEMYDAILDTVKDGEEQENQ